MGKIISSLYPLHSEQQWLVFRHDYKGDNYYDFRFAFLHIMSLLKKKVYSERKEFASEGKKILSFLGSQFFTSRLDPFWEEDKINLDSYLHWKYIRKRDGTCYSKVSVLWRSGDEHQQRQKTYFRICVSSEDSDQPAHLRRLIRILAGRI